MYQACALGALLAALVLSDIMRHRYNNAAGSAVLYSGVLVLGWVAARRWTTMRWAVVVVLEGLNVLYSVALTGALLVVHPAGALLSASWTAIGGAALSHALGGEVREAIRDGRAARRTQRATRRADRRRRRGRLAEQRALGGQPLADRVLLELRPVRRLGWSKAGVWLVGASALLQMAASFTRLLRSAGLLAAIVSTVALVGLVGGIQRLSRRQAARIRLIVISDTLVYQPGSGRSRGFARSSLARIEWRQVMRVPGPVPPASRRRILILDVDGRCVLRLSGSLWTQEQMTQLGETLRVPVTEGPPVRRPKDLGREVPGATTWGEDHRVAVTLVAVAIAVVLTVAMTSMFGHPHHRGART